MGRFLPVQGSVLTVGWAKRGLIVNPFWLKSCIKKWANNPQYRDPSLHSGLLCIAFCLSVCIKGSLEKNYISKSKVPRVMKFGRGIDMNSYLILYIQHFSGAMLLYMMLQILRIPNKGRWAHINVKLLHFAQIPVSVKSFFTVNYWPIPKARLIFCKRNPSSQLFSKGQSQLPFPIFLFTVNMVNVFYRLSAPNLNKVQKGPI